MTFEYRRRLHFYETDAMGIIHHVIYFYLLEEARVEMLRHCGILKKIPLEEINYPVLSAHVDYKKPLYFDDELLIQVKLSIEKVRLYFDYELKTKRFSESVAFGKTMHVAMDMKTNAPTRVPEVVQELIKS